MYEVVYRVNNEITKFVITDSEAHEAIKIWENGGNYFCARLDALLPSRMILASKPKFDVGKDVFVKIYDDKSVQKIYNAKDGDFFIQSRDTDGNTFLKKLLVDKRYLSSKNELTKTEQEFISSLIPVDIYYEKAMNQIFGELSE
jgi:hypothetical protein